MILFWFQRLTSEIGPQLWAYLWNVLEIFLSVGLGTARQSLQLGRKPCDDLVWSDRIDFGRWIPDN